MYTITKYLITTLIVLTMSCYSQSDIFQSNKKYIQLNTGIKMAYVELGENNSETYILLHGYTDSSRSFQQVIEQLYQLSPQSRIIVPDLRGHGSTGLPNSDKGFKTIDFSNDILSLINQLSLNKVHIVGHSFGSMLAQHIALNHPEKVKSLVLMGTFVNGKKNIAVQDFLFKELIYGQWKNQLENTYGSNWKEKTFKLAPLDLGENVTQFLKENWVSEPRAKKSFLDSICKETIHTPLITWFETLKTIREFDNTQNLSALKTPTLIIWGEDDEMMPQNPDQEELKKSLQKANQNFGTSIYYKTYRKKFPNQLNIGHNLHWAFPEEVAADIMSFTKSKLGNESFESETYPIKENTPLQR